jgi:hypothetical protein
MKRLKLILPGKSANDGHLFGLDAKLVDADTGEELECTQDICVHFPMDDIVTVSANFPVAEIEVQ